MAQGGRCLRAGLAWSLPVLPVAYGFQVAPAVAGQQCGPIGFSVEAVARPVASVATRPGCALLPLLLLQVAALIERACYAVDQVAFPLGDRRDRVKAAVQGVRV